MDTAEAGPFNQSQHPWYRPHTRGLPLPLIAYRNGKLAIDASDLAATCKIGQSAIFYRIFYLDASSKNNAFFGCKISNSCTDEGNIFMFLCSNLRLIVSGCTPNSCPCADVARAAASSPSPLSLSPTTTSSAGHWGSIEAIMNVKV